ncbi:MAG: tRNA uridine(34) 5-carboxymethylaminomethyl modification radical SAM/GNAT enzyme Elp3 [Nanoarchaeota archaeon]|nr:tRNA uridine(34) 5-carboxymethylaminomethyl modification radical SAM/GNAT enzyme Elp3 [Nanoarchaeota archaeon]
MELNEFCKLLIKGLISNNIKTPEEAIKLRAILCRKHHPKTMPSFIQILAYASNDEYKKLSFLQSKPSRTIAGVSPIAIMTKPMKCPHGKCVMCPGGVDSFFGNTPQSYTGKEPAARRAMRNQYDAYIQVFNRLEQYTLLNHPVDKSELIIMGGTFPAANIEYQNEFMANALKAMNDFSEMFYIINNHKKAKSAPEPGLFDFLKFKEFFELPGDVNNEERVKRIQQKLLELKGKADLIQEQERNETAKARCVTMCIETRPDYCKESHISQMLKLGCTRVELGVQSIYNDVLKRIERGHTAEDSINATQLMKDSFLKVGYHMMPGLPLSDEKKDVEMFKELFNNPSFKPDTLKIYPCMVVKGTKLYDEWKKGKFKPITTEKAANIIAEAKQFIEPYCRVMRVQRDIPSKFIEAGVDITNLRQEVDKKLKEKKIECRCIRCNEPKSKEIDYAKAKLQRLDYDASEGKEVFLSYNAGKTLLGFCRLRIPFKPFRKEITANTAGIRELHVYAPSAQIGEKPSAKKAQHRGFGIALMEEAENIAKEEFDANKMLVLAGIGAKEYFRRKLGYRDEGAYVGKKL